MRDQNLTVVYFFVVYYSVLASTEICHTVGCNRKCEEMILRCKDRWGVCVWRDQLTSLNIPMVPLGHSACTNSSLSSSLGVSVQAGLLAVAKAGWMAVLLSLPQLELVSSPCLAAGLRWGEAVHGLGSRRHWMWGGRRAIEQVGVRNA